MKHEFKRIKGVKAISAGVLSLEFECGTVKEVDLNPVLKGELFGQLKDLNLFNQVKIDSEVGTIFWPNGADFDPDTLYRWNEVVEEMSNHLKSA